MPDTTNAPPDEKRKSPSTDSVSIGEAWAATGVLGKFVAKHNGKFQLAQLILIACVLLGIRVPLIGSSNGSPDDVPASKGDVKRVDAKLTAFAEAAGWEFDGTPQTEPSIRVHRIPTTQPSLSQGPTP